MAILIIGFPKTGEEWSLDIADSFAPSRTASVTQNDVEQGSNVTDHRIINPLTLAFSGFVSDVPLDSTTKYDNESIGRHTEIRERLETAHENSEFLYVEMGDTRGLYENMLITQLDFNWDAESGNGLNVAMQLQAVRIVSPERRNMAAERLSKKLSYDRKEGLKDAIISRYEDNGDGTVTLVDGPATYQRFSAPKSIGRASGAPSGLSDQATAALAAIGE